MVEDGEPLDIDDITKDYTIVPYLRVSTTGQEGTLSTQEEAVREGAKRLGFKKKIPVVYQEQGSGTLLERPEINRMITELIARKKNGEKIAILVRDIQRFARDPYDIGILYKATPNRDNSLWANDIPIISVNEKIITGTKNHPSPQGDLLAPLLIGIGGQEISTRKVQIKQGVNIARRKGIVAGQPKDLYSDEPLNPFRELVRLIDAGFSQRKLAERLGRSSSWASSNRRFIRKLRDTQGEQGLEDWLATTDIIREFEQNFGPRVGKGAKKPMIAVGRMTSGYLKFPDKFPKPTREDIEFFFDNFEQFQPVRR